MIRFLRLTLVIVLGVFELACIVTTLATFERPIGEYGYNVGSDGETVVAVEPGLPASRAGIVPGDRIAYERMSLAGRLNAIDNSPITLDTPLALDVRHGSTVRTVRMMPQAFPGLYGAADLSFAFAGLCLGAVSLTLVVLRPSRMTWGFALVVPPLVLPEALFLWTQRAPSYEGLAYSLFIAVLYMLQTGGIMTFASRFPTDTPIGFARVIDRLAIPVAIASGCVYIATDSMIWLASAPPPHWLLVAQDFIAPAVPNVLALLAIIATFAGSERGLRNRLAPALAAMTLTLIAAVAQQIGIVATSNPAILLSSYFTFAASAALLAIAVAYGVIRHRVIDVNFFIGRTLVYGAITIFAVSVFSLIEYLFGKLLERGGIATILEIVSAIALGLSLNVLHGRVDRFIDAVLFRRRHLAEARVARTAHNVAYANSTGIVEEMLVNEPVDAFGLASAAIFTNDGAHDSFQRRHAIGWDESDAAVLDADDHLVVRMRAELLPSHLGDLRWPRSDVPSGSQQPIYAIPIVVARRLHAIAVYGAHASGEDVDPDERAALRDLAAGAALAYDHLTTQALRDRIETLRGENAALRHSEELLSSIVSEGQSRSKRPGDA
ncbi:MAG TPA: hypothetical protein VGF18_08695 [Candidatus Tumulicola sp.]|jgi:hypothetical protein